MSQCASPLCLKLELEPRLSSWNAALIPAHGRPWLLSQWHSTARTCCQDAAGSHPGPPQLRRLPHRHYNARMQSGHCRGSQLLLSSQQKMRKRGGPASADQPGDRASEHAPSGKAPATLTPRGPPAPIQPDNSRPSRARAPLCLAPPLAVAPPRDAR